MKKIILAIALFACAVYGNAQDYDLARRTIGSEKGEEVIRHIDYLFNNSTYPDNQIRNYVRGIQEDVKTEDIAAYYLAMFHKSCKYENPDDILYNAQIFLILGGNDDLSEVYSAAAKAAMSTGKCGVANDLLAKMKDFSRANDGWLDADIEQLEYELSIILKKYNEAKKTANWGEGVVGTWVAVDYGTHVPVIVTISNPAWRGGASLIYPTRKVKVGRNNGWLSQRIPETTLGRSQSIQFDGVQRAISIQFASSEIRDRSRLEWLSQSGLELVRDVRAGQNTITRTSNASAGEKALATFATEAGAELADAIFTAISVSSREEEFYSVSMQAVYGDVMNSVVYHNSTKIYSDGRVETWANNTSRCTFVRWEEDDDMLLVSDNGKPIFLGEIRADSPLLNDYKALKWHKSFFNPRSLVPTVAIVGLGGVMMYKGIKKAFPSDQPEDEHWVNQRATFMAVGGFAIALTTFLTSISMSGLSSHDISKINQKGLNKLKRKMQLNLSFSPTYENEYNTLGAAVNISF